MNAETHMSHEHEVKDPVCGMGVDPAHPKGGSAEYAGLWGWRRP